MTDRIACPVCRRGETSPVACPVCGASPGEPCTVASTKLLRGGLHPVRRLRCPCCHGERWVAPVKAAPFLLVLD